MISLAYKISHSLIANHYPELRCVIYTGVTLFAPVLHLNCTDLSHSESSNVFMCIIDIITLLPTVKKKLGEFSHIYKLVTNKSFSTNEGGLYLYFFSSLILLLLLYK